MTGEVVWDWDWGRKLAVSLRLRSIIAYSYNVVYGMYIS